MYGNVHKSGNDFFLSVFSVIRMKENERKKKEKEKIDLAVYVIFKKEKKIINLFLAYKS